jgi:ABC-2 type transport system permease protein
VRDTLRSHRAATGLWVVGGALVMYGMAMAVAKEMREFPGGPAALARSVTPAAEAMRPLRWPAERLDTLGGYLTFHNLTLVTLFLCVYGAVQGSRAIRRSEDQHALEEILSTGWPRGAVLLDRALGFLVTLLAICLGLGLGVAAAMAGGG